MAVTCRAISEVRSFQHRSDRLNIALSGTPLFTATRNNSPQPIMSGIEISTGPGGGISLFFGTGQHFAADDNAVSSTASAVAVWHLG